MDLTVNQIDNHARVISHAHSFGAASVDRPAVEDTQKESRAPMAAIRTPPATRTPCPRAIPDRADPWTKLVSGLLEVYESETAGRNVGAFKTRPLWAANGAPAVSVKHAHAQSTLNKNVRVSFVERCGAKTVSLTWHDSTQACYCEQLWIQKTARSSGRCAVTGMAVRRGDTVYSPASRAAARPLNCAQMILSAVLQSLEKQSADSCLIELR